MSGLEERRYVMIKNSAVTQGMLNRSSNANHAKARKHKTTATKWLFFPTNTEFSILEYQLEDLRATNELDGYRWYTAEEIADIIVANEAE